MTQSEKIITAMAITANIILTIMAPIIMIPFYIISFIAYKCLK